MRKVTCIVNQLRPNCYKMLKYCTIQDSCNSPSTLMVCCHEDGVSGGSDVAHYRHVCGLSTKYVRYLSLTYLTAVKLELHHVHVTLASSRRTAERACNRHRSDLVRNWWPNCVAGTPNKLTISWWIRVTRFHHMDKHVTLLTAVGCI